MTDGHNTLKESLKSKKIPLPEADCACKTNANYSFSLTLYM